MIIKKFPDKQEFQQAAQTHNVIPVCVQILADTLTPVSILKRFYRQSRPVFLLESVEGGEKWGRYSFLGLHPKYEIQIFKDEIRISTNQTNETIPHHGDPVSQLRAFTDRFKPVTMAELPSFWSQMTGYISYEMVSFFENLPLSLPGDEAYARFMIPEEIIIFDTVKHTITCGAIAFVEEGVQPKDSYDAAVEKLETLVFSIFSPPEEDRTSHQKSEIDPADVELMPQMPPEVYKEKVDQIKHHIVEGDIIQAVFSQKFVCDTVPDPVRLYRAQRYINPSPYMFFMNFPQITIIGSSPETMVRFENQTATLRPIAGTRKRGDTQQEEMTLVNDLLNDEKEKAEHLMLVDLGRNDLGRVARTGSVQVSDLMFVEKYSHVMHLVSNIQCDVKENTDAWDILKATFPAGTLSGAPKIKAMEIISQLEPGLRRVYGGAAGYISLSGDMDLAITIRTAVIENSRLTIQAGAGIVYDSDPGEEYLECINKAKSVETALHLAMSKH